MLSSDSIYEFIVKSNKRLDSSNIVEGELGLSSETISEETTSKLRYSPQNLDFSIKTVKGIVNYLSKDGESVFQDINLRVINLTNPMVIIVLIIAIIQILILSLFRKQIISQFNNTKIFFSKIFKKKKSQISVKRYLILGFIVISLVVFFQFVFSASINYPLNNTLVYGESVILNWTVNITNANVWVYGSNNLSRINGSLLFFNQSVPLGNYTYNWTNPTIFDGDDGLTGLFRFNNDTNLGENNTWFVDSSTWDSITTNAICGTNCPNFTEGKFGKALNITNKSVYILDNNEIDGTGVYTVMFWFQYSGAGTATCYSGTNGVYVYPLVVKGTGEAESATQDVFMLIGINQSSRLCNDYEDGINSANHPACGATTIQQDQWYHGAVVVNGTNNVIYLNGIRDGISSNVSNPRTTTIQRIGIGQCYLSTNASTGNAGGNYRGLIEEIAFYNKSMTASEINSYYNLSYGQYYWAVNQTNSTDTDYSGIYTFNLTQDTIYPLFSTYWDNNASLIISGTGLFNVTLTNTNGTVLFEINNVIVAILTPSNYVYKSFCSELNNFDFKLMPVTKAYSSLQQGREIYFLDSENKPVRIKSITKENNYTGRIYDVDVSNDIVLVRRNNNGNFGSAVWSGNSNREDSTENIIENQGLESVIEQGISLTGQAVSEISGEQEESQAQDENVNETIRTETAKTLVNYTAYDLDEDGYIDYVEWSVPHLSNQTYELVIEITKAEHLDENKSFVSDIYEQVKALDGNWSEEIPNEHYVRVTFERNLTKDRYITIYARAKDWNNESNSSISAEIEVYPENNDLMIAKFSGITSENWYKVYLNNLNETESYDVFELRVIGSVEFDYIVDPTAITNIEFISPTLASGSSTTNTSVEINVSIVANNISEVNFNWNVTNYTIYNDSLVLMYNFDNLSALGENATKVVDVSKYGNNGTVQNGSVACGQRADCPNWTTGKYGGAYHFDSINDRIDAGSGSSLDNLNNTGMTITLWAKFDTGYGEGGSLSMIATKSGTTTDPVGSWYFGIVPTGGSAGNLRFSKDTGASDLHRQSVQAVPINSWQYLTLTWTGANVSTGIIFYINGNETTYQFPTNGSATPISDASNILYIGSDIYSGRTINGTLDELRIYNRVLSQDEIVELYMLNLQKYNQTQWYLYVNQSKNVTAGLDNATYTYFASAKDADGNENMTETRTIIIGGAAADTIYPTFSNYWDNNASLIISGTGLFNVTVLNTNGTVLLEINNTNMTATNITANVYNASYEFTENGTYSYKWHSWGNGTSKNYNVSDTRSYSVNSDTTAPLITIISPLNTTYSISSINFNISANENLSFCSVTLNNWVTNYTMTINATGTGANYTNTSIGDGSYTSKFWCNDSSGNINNTEQVTFAIDITLPAVLIVYPLNISYNINVSQLNYTSNGAYCWYSNGTGIWNSTPVTCGANFTNVISIEGSNTWTLYANDSSGNLNSSSVTFFKDTIYPKITIISPLNQTYTTTIINFSVSLNENSSWCGFSLDNSANITMTRFNDTYFNFTNSSMKQGSHSIVFACNDTSGNMNSSSGARVFSIDSIFPNVTLNAPANNANLTNTNVTFNCTSYDDTNLKNVSLYFNSTKGGSSTPTLIQNGTFGHTYNSPATTAPVNLSSLPTSNNLLITAIASDKSAGTYTVPSGFTLIATYSGSSVSGAMAYKISNGSEQNISWSYTTSQESSAWYAEYSGLSTTNVLDIVYENETFASADTTTSQINLRNSTDTSQANELAVAMFGIDTDGSVGTRSWSDGFTEVVFVDAPGTGTAGLGIANKSLSSIGIVNTTFSFTGGTADQMYAILATFKAASSGISWHANQTINISGIRNETIFNLNLTDNSTYSWNCYACDAVNNCNWSASNFTFNISVPIIISDISPNVTLTAPLNGATQSSLNVSFNFTAADDINLVNATLYFETINDITTTLYFQHDGSAVNNTEDAWINLTETNNTNYGSSANLSVDLSPSPEHTIIKFTGIFGTGNDQIPLGATITEANLTLYNEADPGNNAIIYILRENWTEGNVTWNNRTYNGTDWIAWTNQGAYGSTSSDTKINASTTLGTANAYSTSNVTAFVQNWSDGTDNFGFLIYPGGTSGITINSRDNTNVSRRPKLTVTYRTSANTPIAWHANKTISISGILNLTNITQTLLNNRTYSWNIRVCDNATTTCSFATSNFTLTINSSYVPACSEVNVSYFFDPYVMAWNETAEIIRLETNQPSNMTINYGTTTDYGLNISNTSFGTKNEFVLSGLTPDTLYYYRAIVVNDTGSACFQNSSFTSTFKTSNNSRTSFTFAVLADSRGAGCGDQGANFDNLINDIAGKGVDFVIMVGDDIQADAGGCTSHDSYWQGFHNITNIIRRNASFISSPGNHENLDGDSTARTSWRNYWIQPLNGNGSAGEWNETTFYWRYGNSLFISLNTIEIGNIGNITKSQLTWFNESAINQTGYTHKFVFTHYPIVGSNRAGTLSADNPPWSQTLDNMMFNNGVTAAFYGHNHLYCYNITQNGMLHITTGGAGSPLYANQCIGTEISQFHYVLINVTDNVINGTAYNLTGSIINSFSRTMTTTDTIYPLFSTYWDNNATLVNSGTGLFNVTLTNTNGTVWLEINNTNITAINITASVYNASYSFTNNGTYSYKWHSWGNGSSKNYNVSETRSYSVNSSDSIFPNVTLNAPANNANLTNISVTFNCTSYDDTNLKNVSLYFNSTKGGSSTPTLIQNGTFGHTYNSPATTAPVNLSSLPTSNNLLITAIASDKSAGTYTVPSGFTLIATYSGSSVSGAMAYKISNGSEQNISWSYTTSQESSAWYAEYSGLSTTNVLDIVYENETFASADTTTSQINLRNSTDTSQANELAVAMFGIDTDGSVGTRSWSDGFTEVVFVDAPGTGTAGLGIANKSLSSIGIVNTTFSFTGGTADQMYAILATFKAASSGISWHANQTINISGIRNETIFNLNLTDNSTYSWNCYACDAVNNCNWSASNFTFNISVPIIISDISPNVTLTAPLNGATQSSLNVSFNFTAADDINLVNATLYFETINDITTTLYFQHDGSAVNNTEDAWINLTETNNTNYGSSANLSVDLSPSPEHTIIKFTGIFGTGNDQIPLGATITEANLTLYNEADPGNNAIIYILRENWTEGNVTWNNRTYNGTDWIAWTNQGAYGSTSSDTKINASTTLGTANAYSTSNVTAFVQNWSDGTDNFGFLIYPGGTSGITINSRDNTNVSRRPKLTVTYRTSANTPIAWHANKTISISGILNLTNITQTLLNNRTYSWNIRVCDNATTTCSFATSNFTLTINSSYVPACSEVNVSYFFDPYVMAWNETAEIIRLETNQPSNMTINYGTTTDYGLNISNTSFGTKNEFVLSGLTPDTLYYYRAIVVNDTGSACFQNSSFTSTFKTSNNSRTSFTFAVLADSRGAGCGDQGANFDNLINDIAGKGVDFVIMVGDDIQADAGGCTSHDSYWQGFHNITNIIRRNASFISSPGNHENLDGDSTARTSWRNYWIQPLNGNGSAGEWNETTFYWRYGNSLFISLNTIEIGNIGNITKSQLTWFNESAINQTGYTHKFVFTHYPIVGSNRAGTLSADNPPWSQTLDNMMFNNGVTAAFYGHNHLYCYNITQNGMLHITTGGAGSPLYANQCIGTEISQFHYVLINVTDNVINGTAYNLTGSIINSFSRTMTTTDTIYPLFSTYWDNNATLVNSGTGLFNVTLTNTNGTVWLEINNTNITAINITASVYNASYSFTNNGTYSYKWHSWGNGSSKNYNVSETRSYSVNSDTTAPLITIISPLNTTYVSSVINFSISSNENLSFCSVTLNNWVKNYTMTLNASLIGANYTNTSIGDGSYTSKFWCNDSSGNINNTEQVTFSIDTTPPSVSIIYPLNITYNINVSQLNYTSNGVYCWYSNGTGIWNSTPVTCGTNFTNVISIEGSNTWTLYANDSVGNLNSSSVTFSKDTNSPNITLLSPQDGSEDVDGIVDFNYNASDNSNISNCSLYIDDLLEQTDIFITKNVIQTFHIINVKSSDNLIWYINCTDSLNNKGKSLNRRLDTKLGGGGGAGGSGITQSDLVKYLGIKNISILLCNLTYDSASRSLNKYGEIFKIIRDYNLTQEWTEIKKYIDNWQSLCSDQLSKTLNPELVCENIYYFIIDNNYNHHMEEINGLRNKLKPSVVLSFDLLNYYIDDYFSLCYSEGYSKKLPAKQLPIIKVFSVVPTINESLITPCNASVGMSFFDWYIGIPQLFKIHVGEMSCNQLDLWRWVFKIRQETDNGEIKTHSLIGLKLWYLILILFGLLIYITIKTSRGGRKH